MKPQGLIPVALYLGVGALCHAIMIGPQFDWSSAWTWGWLLGWPVAFVFAYWALIVGIAAVCGIVTILVVFGNEVRKEFARRRTIADLARSRNGGH